MISLGSGLSRLSCGYCLWVMSSPIVTEKDVYDKAKYCFFIVIMLKYN